MRNSILTQNDLVRQAIGDSVLESLTGIFGMMQLAENEIARAQELFPDRKDQVWGAFSVLCPPKHLQNHLKLYQVYAREVCERVGHGCDPDHAADACTDAEILAALAQVSLAVPLNGPAFALYAQTFQKYADILDPKGAIDFPEARFDYPGQREEIITEIHRAVLKARSR